jgi:hypothetical protein
MQRAPDALWREKSHGQVGLCMGADEVGCKYAIPQPGKKYPVIAAADAAHLAVRQIV